MYDDCPACWNRELVMNGAQPEAKTEPSRLLRANSSRSVDLSDDSGVGRDARRLKWNWHQAELDAPFHTDHVFWHIVRTYIGLARIRLEPADLTKAELDQVEAVRDDDRRNEMAAWIVNNKAQHGEQKGFVKSPPAPYTPQGSVHAARVKAAEARLAALRAAEGVAQSTTSAQARLTAYNGAGGESGSGKGIGIAAVLILVGAIIGLVYFADTESGEFISARAPVLRQTSQIVQQQDDDQEDEDLVTDAARKLEDSSPGEDPAAE